MLHSQRRVAAAVAAPGAGTGGQNLELALMVADGGPKGRADPAYDAHKLPIGEWAFAVWEGHMAIASMNCTVQFAKKKMRKATNPWKCCYGPADAFVLSCWRLGWKVHDATKLETDERGDGQPGRGSTHCGDEAMR